MGYIRPDTIAQALEARRAGASVIAGGTDWYPSRGEAPLPQSVLDVTRLPGFSGITAVGGGWRIGAATPWTTLVRTDLPPAFDALKQAAVQVGSLQIQNAGTVGGNLCNASPAADGMPPLLALDAAVELVGPQGTRQMPLSEFVTGVRQTALAPDELLAALILPDPGDATGAFVKLGARKYLVISIAMVAAVVRMDQGRLAQARVAVGACSPVARRLPALEQALQGGTVADLPARINADHLSPLSPISDVRGSADYRRDVVLDLIRRAVAQAMEAAHG